MSSVAPPGCLRSGQHFHLVGDRCDRVLQSEFTAKVSTTKKDSLKYFACLIKYCSMPWYIPRLLSEGLLNYVLSGMTRVSEAKSWLQHQNVFWKNSCIGLFGQSRKSYWLYCHTLWKDSISHTILARHTIESITNSITT